MRDDRTTYEILVDIEALLKRLVETAEQTGICDHGNRGVCMSCVIAHDLLRPKP